MLFPLRMPVELVRGGMAFGEAKGWDGDVDGMVVFADRQPVGSLLTLMWVILPYVSALGRERVSRAPCDTMVTESTHPGGA